MSKYISGLINYSKQQELYKLKQINFDQTFDLQQKLLNALEIFSPFISYRFIAQNKYIFNQISQIIYYWFTTWNNKKTIGEECSYLLKFNENDFKNTGKLISQKRNLVLFILSIFGEPVLKNLLEKWYDSKISKSYEDQQDNPLKYSLFTSILKHLPQSFESFLQLIYVLHFSLFLLKGNYITLAEQILGIKYITTQQQQNKQREYYRIGIFLLIKNAISFITFVKSIIQHYITSMKKQNIQQKFNKQIIAHNKGFVQYARTKYNMRQLPNAGIYFVGIALQCKFKLIHFVLNADIQINQIKQFILEIIDKKQQLFHQCY